MREIAEKRAEDVEEVMVHLEKTLASLDDSPKGRYGWDSDELVYGPSAPKLLLRRALSEYVTNALVALGCSFSLGTANPAPKTWVASKQVARALPITAGKRLFTVEKRTKTGAVSRPKTPSESGNNSFWQSFGKATDLGQTTKAQAWETSETRRRSQGFKTTKHSGTATPKRPWQGHRSHRTKAQLAKL